VLISAERRFRPIARSLGAAGCGINLSFVRVAIRSDLAAATSTVCALGLLNDTGMVRGERLY